MTAKLRAHTGTVEDVVTKNESRGVSSNMISTKDKCLGKSVRHFLNGIRDIDTKLRTVAQQAVESFGIMWCRNDKDVLDTCKHQR